jgi:hypothetical protein
LEADINAQNVTNVFELNRSLIVGKNSVFLVKDSMLVKQQILIIHSNENTLVIKGLKDSSELISVPVPGGYEGMKVAVKN